MALRDVNWGGVVLGAAAVTAITALALAPGGALAASALAANSAATLTGAAVTGGIAGNMVSNLGHRVQDSATTLIQR